MSSGRTIFGSGRRLLSAMSFLARRILAGDQVDAAAHAGGGLAVARVLRALLEHAQPGKQGTAPPLGGGNRDCLLHERRRGGAVLQLYPRGDQPGQRIRGRGVLAASGKVFRVGQLFLAGAAAQRLEAGAIVELQAGSAHCASQQLRTSDKVFPARASELRPRAREFRLGAGVPHEVILLESLQGLRGVELPVGWLGTARATADENRRHNHEPHGSLISVLRSKGHLRFISSRIAETLRRLASTSARSAARSELAALAFPLIFSASARTRSSLFRLSRTSPRMVFAWATARCVPSISPPSPYTR